MDPNLLTHFPIIGHHCSNTDTTIISLTGESKADKTDTGRLSHELCIWSGRRQFLLFNLWATNRRPVVSGVREWGEELKDMVNEGIFKDKYWDLMRLESMLVSCDICNKLPQIWWLKEQQTSVLSRFWSLKSKARYCRVGSFLRLGRICFMPLSQLLAAAHSPCISPVCGHISPVSASILTWSSLSCIICPCFLS